MPQTTRKSERTFPEYLSSRTHESGEENHSCTTNVAKDFFWLDKNETLVDNNGIMYLVDAPYEDRQVAVRTSGWSEYFSQLQF